MNTKTIYYLFFILLLTGCKTLIKCSARQGEREEEIRTNAKAAILNFFEQQADADGGSITEIDALNMGEVRKRNDSTIVVVEMYGRYKRQGLQYDTGWHEIKQDTSYWYYKEQGGRAYVENVEY